MSCKGAFTAGTRYPQLVPAEAGFTRLAGTTQRPEIVKQQDDDKLNQQAR